jgi:hypothetical protein
MLGNKTVSRRLPCSRESRIVRATRLRVYRGGVRVLWNSTVSFAPLFAGMLLDSWPVAYCYYLGHTQAHPERNSLLSVQILCGSSSMTNNGSCPPKTMRVPDTVDWTRSIRRTSSSSNPRGRSRRAYCRGTRPPRSSSTTRCTSSLLPQHPLRPRPDAAWSADEMELQTQAGGFRQGGSLL